MKGNINHKRPWQLISHTADLQIRVHGTTLEELFINSLKGMFESIRPDGPHIEKTDTSFTVLDLPVKRKIRVEAETREMLLIDFLNECLYLSDVNNEAYFDADFSVFEEDVIQATIFGMPITRFEVVEIKAVTYHNNKIARTDGKWTTDIVFDI